MRVNRGLLGWGVFFIVAGIIPLAVQAGAIDESFVTRAWQLWPLILIGIGLGLVLQRTQAAVIGGLVVAVTAGLMAGGALAAGIQGIDSFGGFTACDGSRGGTPFADQRATMGDQARYQVELDCGDVTIGTMAGQEWMLTGTSHDGAPPEVTVRADGVAVRTPERSGTIGFATTSGVDWTMTLPQAPRSQLELSVNAGSAKAVLDGMALSRVQASVNAGSAVLDLADAGALDRLSADVNAGSLGVAFPAVDVTADVSANMGSLELCVPSGVDLRIRLGDNALGSNNFGDEGLVERDGTWESPGFGSAEATIEINASANLGSIELNPEDGCG